jgi:hypothetical protein
LIFPPPVIVNLFVAACLVLIFGISCSPFLTFCF